MTSETSNSASKSRPPVGQRPTRVRWLILALACGTSWFLYLHRYTWNFIRPELEKEFGFNNRQLEGLYSLFNFSYAAGQIPSGVLCDFFGPHLLLAMIIVLWSLVLPTFGAATGVYGLGGARLLFGAAQAGGLLDYYSVQQTVDGVERTVTNFTPMFVLVAAMYLISACCWFGIDCTQSLDREE